VNDATLNVIMVWIIIVIIGCAIYLMIADPRNQ